GLIFIDLRDHTGIIQLTFSPDQPESFALAGTLRDEFVIEVQGKVVQRAADLINPNIETGTVEVQVSELEILNKSKALPFPIENQGEVSEDLRLKYRFLDLRRKKMQERLQKLDEY